MNNNPGPKRPTLADLGVTIWLGSTWTRQQKLEVLGNADAPWPPTNSRLVHATGTADGEPGRCIGVLMPPAENVGFEPYYERNRT